MDPGQARATDATQHRDLCAGKCLRGNRKSLCSDTESLAPWMSYSASQASISSTRKWEKSVRAGFPPTVKLSQLLQSCLSRGWTSSAETNWALYPVGRGKTQFRQQPTLQFAPTPMSHYNSATPPCVPETFCHFLALLPSLCSTAK